MTRRGPPSAEKDDTVPTGDPWNSGDRKNDWADLIPIIIRTNKRGMRDLAACLDESHIMRAASALLALPCSDPVNICTGFPVQGRPETDGPAGALALAGALIGLGREVRLASYPEVLQVIGPLTPGAARHHLLPCGATAPRLDGPAISIEICGRVKDGSYRNMRGQDIGASAPWFETAIGLSALVSIGDGGNEFGMGSAPRQWFDRWKVEKPVSICSHLVPAEVSNWGALGVVAALSRLTGQDLLPGPEEYDRLLNQLAEAGFVDGMHGTAMPTEDGWPAGTGRSVVAALRDWTGLSP